MGARTGDQSFAVLLFFFFFFVVLPKLPIRRSHCVIHRACFGQVEFLISASISPPGEKKSTGGRATAVAAAHQSEVGASDAQPRASGAPFAER